MQCECVSCRPELARPSFTFPPDTPEWWTELWIWPGQNPPLKPTFKVEERSLNEFELIPVAHDDPGYLAFISSPLKLRQEHKDDSQLNRCYFDYWWHRPMVEPKPWPRTSDLDLYRWCWRVEECSISIKLALETLGIQPGNRTSFVRLLKAYQEYRLLPYKSR